MNARINRDVVAALGEDDEVVKMIKKRKRHEVFPEEEVKGDHNAKRKKVNEEIQQYSASVKEYFEGIKIVKT